MPRVVRAGVPMRMPEGSIGLRSSKGIMFLLTVMPQRSSACFGQLAADAERRDVDQHQVIVGAAADQLQAAGEQRFGQRLGVVDDLLGVRLELGPQRFAEADRLAGDDVHQRAALDAGEHAAVDRLAVLFLGTGTGRPRGPRSVLCVVVVTKSATGTGLSCSPAATRPA